MHVSLTERLDDYVRQKVASGLYNNASEVIREALRRQIEHEMSEEAKLERLREAINVGWEQADRGEVSKLDVEQILSDLDAEMAVDA